jgi:hypothetical protein
VNVHVIPLKNGCWRVVHVGGAPLVIEGAVWLSEAMLARWRDAWVRWWSSKGERLDISPEMWI